MNFKLISPFTPQGDQPEAIRQLLEEADGCLNMTFSVGGSACARRAIRKTFEVEDVDEGDFAASVHALAQKHAGVAPTLFRTICTALVPSTQATMTGALVMYFSKPG